MGDAWFKDQGLVHISAKDCFKRWTEAMWTAEAEMWLMGEEDSSWTPQSLGAGRTVFFQRTDEVNPRHQKEKWERRLTPEETDKVWSLARGKLSDDCTKGYGYSGHGYFG